MACGPLLDKVAVVATAKRYLWALLTAALTVGTGWLGVAEVFSICADSSLWKSGTPARDVRVDGEVRSRKFLNTYKLKVKYRDAAGATHNGKTEFMSFTSIDEKKPAEVHYDPRDPAHYSLSWAQEVPGGRWSAALLFILCIPLFGFGTYAILKERPAAPAPPAGTP